jgi:hypothetical protein
VTAAAFAFWVVALLNWRSKLEVGTVAARRRAVRMGRPPGPPESVRRNRVATTLTDAELQALEKLAVNRGLPLGTLIHELLARALRARNR